MTDKPIIFRAPMVRALLDGTKTQTRRVLKPVDGHTDLQCTGSGKWFWWTRGSARPYAALRLPYAIGDRLWVKETWGLGVSDHGDCPRYKATMDYQCGDKIKSPHKGPFNWRSPIYMPRWASRLTLHVTDVRVQRVPDITDEDAVAEGATSRPGVWPRPDWSMDWSEIGRYSRHMRRKLRQEDIALGAPRWAFAHYWNSLHGLDAWERNDWVAAITFDVEARS